MPDNFAETVRRNLHPEYNSLPLAEALIAVDKVLAERDRYRLAWQSARQRAEGSHLTAVANAEACDHARDVGNQLHQRVAALAADMRTWCSPHGLANHYADQLDQAITGPGGEQ